jgi:hypothetical protein
MSEEGKETNSSQFNSPPPPSPKEFLGPRVNGFKPKV